MGKYVVTEYILYMLINYVHAKPTRLGIYKKSFVFFFKNIKIRKTLARDRVFARSTIPLNLFHIV